MASNAGLNPNESLQPGRDGTSNRSRNLDAYDFPIRGSHPALMEAQKQKFTTPTKPVLAHSHLLQNSSKTRSSLSQSQPKLLGAGGSESSLGKAGTRPDAGAYADGLGRFKGQGSLVLKKDRSLTTGIGPSHAGTARPLETPAGHLTASDNGNPETSPRERAGMKLYMPTVHDHHTKQQKFSVVYTSNGESSPNWRPGEVA